MRTADRWCDACKTCRPTPAEIRAACLEIQAEWTPIERYRRSGGRDKAALIEALQLIDAGRLHRVTLPAHTTTVEMPTATGSALRRFIGEPGRS